MTTGLQGEAPFGDFQEASEAVLALLQEQYPMGLWMITRTLEDDWLVLRSADRGYDVAAGDLFVWSESFCTHMVRGEGPNVARDSGAVPAYAQAPIGQQIPISSYIGFPLVVDGELFGTLCAIDPQVRPADWQADEGLIRTLSRLLSTILETEIRATRLSGLAQDLLDAAHRDHLTGVLNRAGWDRLFDRAQRNRTSLGSPHCVVIIDLDGLKALNDREGHGAGDDYLVRAAAAISSVTRGMDAVARIGGDEFGVLLEEPEAIDPQGFVARLETALQKSGVAASCGWALSDARASLSDAVATADARMYESKRARRT